MVRIVDLNLFCSFCNQCLPNWHAPACEWRECVVPVCDLGPDVLTVYVNSDTPLIVPEVWLGVCRTCQIRRFPDDCAGDSSDECKKDSTDESKKDKNDDGDGRGSKHKITKRKTV